LKLEFLCNNDYTGFIRFIKIQNCFIIPNWRF
jgi:hypothetical protein